MPPSVARVTQVERELEAGDCTIGELMARTGMTQTAVYNAIAALTSAGVRIVKRYHLEREDA